MATILFSRACGKISVVFPAAIQFCSWVCMEIVAGQTQATLSPMIFPGEMWEAEGVMCQGWWQIKESLNHRVAGVVRYLKDHALPTPCNGQDCHPLGQAAQGPIRPGLVAEELHFYSV